MGHNFWTCKSRILTGLKCLRNLFKSIGKCQSISEDQTCIPVFHFLNGMRAQQRFLKCRVQKCNCIVQDGFYKGSLGKCFMTGREYFGRHIYPRNVQCSVTMYIFTKILCNESFHLWKFILLFYAIEAFANCHSLKSLNS